MYVYPVGGLACPPSLSRSNHKFLKTNSNTLPSLDPTLKEETEEEVAESE